MDHQVHYIGQCVPANALDQFRLPSRMDHMTRFTTEVDPVECAERVEAMVSTAILHQEDIWDMLLTLFPDSASGHNAAAVKRKLQTAMDWCRLAQCRLQGIIVANSNHASSKTRSIQSAAGGC